MGESLTAYALVAAVLTTLGNAWSRREQRLEKQSELANDSEKLSLRAEVKTCDADRIELRADVAKIETELKSELATLRGQLQSYMMPIPAAREPRASNTGGGPSN